MVMCAGPRSQWHTDEDGATAKWPEEEIAWDDEGGEVDLASLAQSESNDPPIVVVSLLTSAGDVVVVSGPRAGPIFGLLGGGKTPSITISNKSSDSQKGSGKAPSAAMYSLSQDFFVGLKGTM